MYAAAPTAWEAWGATDAPPPPPPAVETSASGTVAAAARAGGGGSLGGGFDPSAALDSYYSDISCCGGRGGGRSLAGSYSLSGYDDPSGSAAAAIGAAAAAGASGASGGGGGGGGGGGASGGGGGGGGSGFINPVMEALPHLQAFMGQAFPGGAAPAFTEQLSDVAVPLLPGAAPAEDAAAAVAARQQEYDELLSGAEQDYSRFKGAPLSYSYSMSPEAAAAATGGCCSGGGGGDGGDSGDGHSGGGDSGGGARGLMGGVYARACGGECGGMDPLSPSGSLEQLERLDRLLQQHQRTLQDKVERAREVKAQEHKEWYDGIHSVLPTPHASLDRPLNLPPLSHGYAVDDDGLPPTAPPAAARAVAWPANSNPSSPVKAPPATAASAAGSAAQTDSLPGMLASPVLCATPPRSDRRRPAAGGSGGGGGGGGLGGSESPQRTSLESLAELEAPLLPSI